MSTINPYSFHEKSAVFGGVPGGSPNPTQGPQPESYAPPKPGFGSKVKGVAGSAWNSTAGAAKKYPGLTGAAIGALGTAGAGLYGANRAENNWNDSSWWSKLKSILSMLFGNETTGSTARKYLWSKQASDNSQLVVTDDNPYKF
jgi:hypothetical protein